MPEKSDIETLQAVAETAAEHPDQAIRAFEGDPTAMAELYSELDPDTREAINAKMGPQTIFSRIPGGEIVLAAIDPKPPHDANNELQATASSQQQRYHQEMQERQRLEAEYSSATPKLTRDYNTNNSW